MKSQASAAEGRALAIFEPIAREGPPTAITTAATPTRAATATATAITVTAASELTARTATAATAGPKSAAAAATAAAARSTIFTGTCFVHFQFTALKIVAVKLGDRLSSSLGSSKGHKCKALATAGFTISWEVNILYRTGLFEEGPKILGREPERNVSDKDFRLFH